MTHNNDEIKGQRFGKNERLWDVEKNIQQMCNVFFCEFKIGGKLNFWSLKYYACGYSYIF